MANEVFTNETVDRETKRVKTDRVTARRTRSANNSKIQFRILPVTPSSLASVGWTAKVNLATVVFDQLDIPSNKQVLALRAKAHLSKRPPMFERIARLKKL